MLTGELPEMPGVGAGEEALKLMLRDALLRKDL